jgi:hypothetical protein
MTPELLAMLGGGASGFIFKLVGTLVQNQAALTKGTRRIIVLTVLFGVIIAPFILANSDGGVTIATDYSNWFGLFKGTNYQTLHGYIILPEIKTAVISIISFYFGSAAVSK